MKEKRKVDDWNPYRVFDYIGSFLMWSISHTTLLAVDNIGVGLVLSLQLNFFNNPISHCTMHFDVHHVDLS